MFTRFMDMHSGGGTQMSPYEYIYIEAPEDEAKVIFYNRFGFNPERVTCTCCGNDYSISCEETLAKASAYDRGCEYSEGEYVERPQTRGYGNKYVSVDEYMKRNDVLVIHESEIPNSERKGDVPVQGYVWA